MKKKIMPFFTVLLITLNLYSQECQETVPKDTLTTNYVPNEETAKKIAEAIWLPIFGERIFEQRPYKATLVNDVWKVRGLMPLPCRNEPGCRGGTAYIEIRKSDCKILLVKHGR
ncbi:hypothetical protein G7051_00495 [Dysgonomonas sp. HDW5B]|uniref:YbbC/YhhH family protein n=1 Tax=Dysgonomonas sp. HDW5B TaxID=2714927 RepID=UPI00140A82B3|nr:YbbC/YhhH family protein [Dysgonomonas sp. HDW5B]QIK52904.1 hypothetical protein G7051_00495 [Dysgonomonas sp. HDW5B]